MDKEKFIVVPSIAAGDPFVAGAKHSRPCVCLGGYVYVGHLVEGEDGVEVEVFEAVPCQRCHPGDGEGR